MSCPCDFSLDLKEFAVLEPNPRHLVHEHKSTLEDIVDSLVRRIGDALLLNSIPPLTQINIPQLEAPRQCFQSSFKHQPSNFKRGLRSALLLDDTPNGRG